MIGWLARGGFTTKDTEGTKRTGEDRGGKLDGDYRCSNRLRAKALTGDGARRGPRNDTEDHGIGEGMIGWLARGGFTTKDTEGTKRTGEDRGGKPNDDYGCSNR
jgi:hypothetical protein